MKYDGAVSIAVGASRRSTMWENKALKWSAFVERLKKPKRTPETMDEFKAMPKEKQRAVKDVGGFVGGTLRNKRRKNDSVAARSMLTLDMDYITSALRTEVSALPPENGGWADLKSLPNGAKTTEGIVEKIVKQGVASVVFSTHSHYLSGWATKNEGGRQEKEGGWAEKNVSGKRWADSKFDTPRLRLILPLSRNVSTDEYEAIARLVASEIGIDYFDDTTYEPARLMFWPSIPKDAEYIFHLTDAPWLDADEWLKKYTDWHDITSWPRSSRQEKVIKKRAEVQGDPLAKSDAIGAFCRAYDVPAAIEAFLPGLYEPAGGDRYTYAEGSAEAGVVIYDDGLYAFSHHGTDPAGGRLCNSFDLVRLHKFPDADEAASVKAMIKFAAADAAVKAELFKERVGMFDEEDEWQAGLSRDKHWNILPTLENLTLIFDNDPNLNIIAYNEHRECLAYTERPIWAPRKYPNFCKSDLAHIVVYLSQTYDVYAPVKTKTAFEAASDRRRFHPIKDYFDALPDWDGTPRAETLLLDYLGADDSGYVRAVTRKTLAAAVSRIYNPGVKFDYVLVLNGAQAIGKSTLFRRLAGGAWYNDGLTLTDMQDKDGAEKLQGYWILELSELAGMRKADLESVKSFISRENDKYRPSYGEVVEDHPRQCVIIATVNGMDGFLRDVTGNRRFWPVSTPGGTNRHSWDITDEDVLQIWAEALTIYKSGEKLYLEGDIQKTAEEEQIKAVEDDPREGLITAYLDTLLTENWDTLDLYKRRSFLHGDNDFIPENGVVERVSVCALEIWCECFGNEASRMEKRDSYMISTILIKLGWRRSEKIERIPIYGRQRLWTRK